MSEDVNIERLQLRPEEINKATGRILLNTNPPQQANPHPKTQLPKIHPSAAQRGNAAAGPVITARTDSPLPLILTILCVLCLAATVFVLTQNHSLAQRLTATESTLADLQASQRNSEQTARELARMEGRWETLVQNNQRRDEDMTQLRSSIDRLNARLTELSQIEEVEVLLAPSTIIEDP